MKNCLKDFLELVTECRALCSRGTKGRELAADRLNDGLARLSTKLEADTARIKIAGISGQSVLLLRDQAACISFAGYMLDVLNKTAPLENNLEYITDFFGKSLLAPRAGVLTPWEVEELLNIVQGKFNLISAVTCVKNLDIYLINRSHKCYDSFLVTCPESSKGIWRNKLILFSLSPCIDVLQCNRYFVFLHEIGHILYNAATENGKTDPEFFEEIGFILGLPGSARQVEKDELFADIFSAAALYGTKYSAYNPYKTLFAENILDFLELYFRMLSYKLEREYSRNAYEIIRPIQ